MRLVGSSASRAAGLSGLSIGDVVMKKLAILVSGRGSNFAALADAIQSGKLRAEIAIVLSNKADAAALQLADDRGIRAEALPSHGVDTDAWAAKALALLKPLDIDLICLAGFMRRVGQPLLKAYAGRILNIHPSLLPSFPGLHVQQQALDYGVKFSGCTVHFVDEGIDSGPILAQAVVPVYDGDTADTLSARILKEEHRIFPEAVARVLSGAYQLEGRRVLHVEAAPAAEKRKSLTELLEKAEKDTRSILGTSVGALLATWRQMASYAEADLIRFLKEWLRRPDSLRVRLMDREGGLSVERIVLDYYPERFSPDDHRVARKSLGI
jgi:phosphoribosylglycinamide formyltransferase 1